VQKRVDEITASILDIGQQTPILVRADGARFLLVDETRGFRGRQYLRAGHDLGKGLHVNQLDLQISQPDRGADQRSGAMSSAHIRTCFPHSPVIIASLAMSVCRQTNP
jgi:hypothetical protein